MDPKMDAGMNQMKNGTRKVLNFEQAVKANKLELKNVPFSLLIGRN